MSNNGFARRTASAVALLLVPVVGGVVLRWSLAVALDASRRVREPVGNPRGLVEDTVVLACATVLVAAVVWLLAGVITCLVDALQRGAGANATVAASPGGAGLLRPPVVRALVALALGSAVTTAGPVVAATRGDPSPSARPALPALLDGLPLPERPYGGVRTHQVTTGESLWSITAAHLPPGVEAERLARSWPRLYRLNRHRIGADPDVIHPGTTLRLPTWGTAPTRGAPR